MIELHTVQKESQNPHFVRSQLKITIKTFKNKRQPKMKIIKMIAKKHLKARRQVLKNSLTVFVRVKGP